MSSSISRSNWSRRWCSAAASSGASSSSAGAAARVVDLADNVFDLATFGIAPIGSIYSADYLGPALALLGLDAALLEQVGQRVGVTDGLLDEERDALGAPDVEDAHEPVVVEAGGSSGGVEGGVGVGLLLGEADDDHIALERRVVGRPAFGLRQLLEAAFDGAAE